MSLMNGSCITTQSLEYFEFKLIQAHRHLSTKNFPRTLRFVEHQNEAVQTVLHDQDLVVQVPPRTLMWAPVEALAHSLKPDTVHVPIPIQKAIMVGCGYSLQHLIAFNIVTRNGEDVTERYIQTYFFDCSLIVSLVDLTQEVHQGNLI